MDRVELHEPDEVSREKVEELEVKQMLSNDANEKIMQEFEGSIPQEKQDIRLSERINYQNEKDFREGYLEKDPGASREQVEQTLGYYDRGEKEIYINKEAKDQYELTVHEGLHAYEHEGARFALGERLNEGVDQHFTKEIDRIELVDDAKIYRREREIVDMISARVGDEPLRQAYFKGDISSLRRELDWQLGEGAFDEIRSKIDQGDYERAKEILKYGL